MVRPPWLSVVMPTYNGEQFLSKALESIMMQDERDIEIVAVDDGSTDDTLGVLRSYIDRLPLRISEQERGENWVVGTNRGLRSAVGTYISLLHQDDFWMPGRLRAIKRLLASGTVPSLLVHPVWFVDIEGKPIGRWRCPLPTGRDLHPDIVTDRLIVQNFISVPGAVFPRELALDLGGLDERLWYTADWDLWLRLARRGTTRYLPTLLAAFRIHPRALTLTRSAQLHEFRQQLEIVLDRHLIDPAGLGAHGEGVAATARFSVEVNVALAAMAHRRRPHLLRLLLQFLQLGPARWGKYIRDSRILERTRARLRASL